MLYAITMRQGSSDEFRALFINAPDEAAARAEAYDRDREGSIVALAAFEPEAVEPNEFDPSTLDEDGAATYRKRVYIGERCMALAHGGPAPADDRETAASDAISDILTALYGPAGTYRYESEEVLDKSLPRYQMRPDAQHAARTLLQDALESWYGDAEDYTVIGS